MVILKLKHLRYKPVRWYYAYRIGFNMFKNTLRELNKNYLQTIKDIDVHWVDMEVTDE